MRFVVVCISASGLSVFAPSDKGPEVFDTLDAAQDFAKRVQAGGKPSGDWQTYIAELYEELVEVRPPEYEFHQAPAIVQALASEALEYQPTSDEIPF